MDKKQTYITDEERINCQKVTDAFSELYENEDLLVLNAGRYGLRGYFEMPAKRKAERAFRQAVLLC